MSQPVPDLRLGDRRWLPGVAAAAVVFAVVAAGVAGALNDGGSSSDLSATIDPTTSTTIGAPVASVTETTVPPRDKTELSQALGQGNAGPEVEQVQDRLSELGFELGPVDGYFGDLTRQAVWAYEKLVIGTPRSEATGVVTPQMWQRMQDDITIVPRRSHADQTHTEVYLPEQVVIFFDDDEPVLISHASSGDDAEWCSEVTIEPGEYGNEDGDEPLVRGECGISYTPPGVFEFDRQVEGQRESALGSMWDPMYFNYGIAIHGAGNVPLEPASHGCIRVPLAIGEMIQDIASLGDTVYVFDGISEPEDVSEQDSLPVFNWRDPDWVPPTTAPPPTEPPATTTAPTITTAPTATGVPSTTATTVAPSTTGATTTVAPTTSPPPPPPSTRADRPTTTTAPRSTLGQ